MYNWAVKSKYQQKEQFDIEFGYWDNTGKRNVIGLLKIPWTIDAKFGAFSHEELDKRWLGSDAVSWSEGRFSTDIKPELSHKIDRTFTTKEIDETRGPCKVGGVDDVKAKMLAQALVSVQVATSSKVALHSLRSLVSLSTSANHTSP